MGAKTVLQGLCIAAGMGLGGAALSIRSECNNVQPLETPDGVIAPPAFEKARSPGEHRRICAYRIDSLMSSRQALEDVLGSTVAVTTQPSDHLFSAQPPIAPSLGALYAAHAMEGTSAFRWRMIQYIFYRSWRLSDISTWWIKTRPAALRQIRAEVQQQQPIYNREDLIHEESARIEEWSSGYCNLKLTTETNEAVFSFMPLNSVEGDEPTRQMLGVRIGQPMDPERCPRSVPLYIYYITEPRNSEVGESWQEQLRWWWTRHYISYLAVQVSRTLSTL